MEWSQGTCGVKNFFSPKMSILAIFGALCSGSIVVILPYISSPLGLRASNSIYTEMRTLFPTKLAKTLYSPIQHYIFSSFKRLLGYYTVLFLAPKKNCCSRLSMLGHHTWKAFIDIRHKRNTLQPAQWLIGFVNEAIMCGKNVRQIIVQKGTVLMQFWAEPYMLLHLHTIRRNSHSRNQSTIVLLLQCVSPVSQCQCFTCRDSSGNIMADVFLE